MRRGLIAWSKTEMPAPVFAARVERTRAAMRDAGIDALAIYTNNTRPSAASWLCGFVPYWSEGMLVLPRDRAPVLVVAMSKRVLDWVEATSCVGEVASAPRVGLEAGKLIAAGVVVGVTDLDELPAGVAEDFAAAGHRMVDATALLARVRGKADPAELALASKAAAIAQRALAKASAKHATSAKAIAAVEAEARLQGAEETYVAAASDLARDRRFLRPEGSAALGASFAIRATVAYKGVWVRAARTIFRDAAAAPLAQRAAEQFAASLAQLPSAQGFAGASSWLVEGCRTAQPLAPLMGSRVADAVSPMPGSLVSVQACIEVDGHPVLLGAPALIGGAGEAAGMLVAD
jgi:hypothetical protein